MVDSLHLGDIIDETGGLGRFQIMIYFLIELFALSHAWSLLFMSYGSATPDYVCHSDLNQTLLWENTTDQCKMADDSTCSTWNFSQDMRTVVSEVSRSYLKLRLSACKCIFYGNNCHIDDI